jgi:hypothetical protein
VDAGLNENQVELGVLILAVGVKMLAHTNSLLNEEIEILREFSCEASGLENTENFVTGDGIHLSDTVLITKDDTDLGRGHTLLGHLSNHVLDLKMRKREEVRI